MSEQLIATPSTFGENGNFLLERELGQGGMGGVYMGRDKMLDRPVAVKVMLKEYGADAEFVEKFKKEAQSAAKLIHPNIAQIYSYGICDGMPYIAMELVAGGSLYQLMQNASGKTDIPRVLKICQQVAQALQCASDQGFVHGDVKPENILLDANGNAKLVDFGLAAMQKNTDEIWGTPYYISPEKVKKEQVDFRADIYSLGGTLYHALTGVAPFEGEDSIAVVKKRFDGAPKKPSEIRPEITPAIDELVMTMLALEKENRYPTFEALLAAFRSVLTTGLTQKIPAQGEANSRPAATGGRRVVMRTRRMSTVKRSSSNAGAGKVSESTAAEDGEVAELPEEGSSEDEGGGNLALKVVLFVLGGILAIGAVVGGLIWFKVSSATAQKEEIRLQIQSGYDKAKAAVTDTVAKAKSFADEFDTFAKGAVTECEKPTDELYKILPMEQAKKLRPASSKALDEAISLTNGVPPTVPVPAITPATTTNMATAAKASTNAPAAKAMHDAKAVAPTKKDDTSKDDVPQIVVTMNELWERAYACQACAIRIRQQSQNIVKKAAEIDQYAEVNQANMEKIAELSRTLVEMLDAMKGSKDVETVKKGIGYIRDRGKKAVEQTVKQLRIEKLEAERKKKAEETRLAEEERLKKLATAHKAKVETETNAIREKFDAIASQGSFRQLDWKGALRQLEQQKSEFETAEGQLAADIEIRKVNCMKKVHDIFIKSCNGHTFKGKLKGGKVSSVNEKDIQVEGGKKKVRLTWQKFYKEYPGNLNEFINEYIIGGRQHAKPKLSLRDWAEAMMGSALTMQLVCSEVNGAVEKAEKLAKEAVKQFPDCAKTAQDIFPNIKFEQGEDE